MSVCAMSVMAVLFFSETLAFARTKIVTSITVDENTAFGTVDSWLVWKLTGGAVHATDATNASRTMLYNIREGCWDDELLQAINPEITLPHELISVVVRSDESGQTSILTKAIGYHVDSWPETAIGKQPHWPIYGSEETEADGEERQQLATIDDYTQAQEDYKAMDHFQLGKFVPKYVQKTNAGSG